MSTRHIRFPDYALYAKKLIKTDMIKGFTASSNSRTIINTNFMTEGTSQQNRSYAVKYYVVNKQLWLYFTAYSK